MPEQQYQRLTRGRARSAFAVVSATRSSLWLGGDHLLCLDATGYTESYKRFYFRDIQAITLRQTNRWIIWAVIQGSVAGLFALSALASQEVTVRWLFAIVAALFFLVLAVNLARGPTCVCHLRTAVQTEPLVSLNRVRRARRVLDRLRPLILQAQGPLAPEDIPALLQTTTTPGAGAEASPAATSTVATDDPTAPPSSSA
jgi:hypothetical protein